MSPEPYHTKSISTFSVNTKPLKITIFQAASEAVNSLYLQRGNDSEKATSESTAGADDLSRTTSEDSDGRRGGSSAVAIAADSSGGLAGRRRGSAGGGRRRGARRRRRRGSAGGGRGRSGASLHGSRGARADGERRRRDLETGDGTAGAEDALESRARDGGRLRAAALAGEVGRGTADGGSSGLQAGGLRLPVSNPVRFKKRTKSTYTAGWDCRSGGQALRLSASEGSGAEDEEGGEGLHGYVWIDLVKERMRCLDCL